MAGGSFVRKQLPIATTAALLALAGWILYRNFVASRIAAPPTVRVGQRIRLHVSFPGWREERFFIWTRLNDNGEFSGQVAYAERLWDGRYHFKGGFRPSESPGTCELFLTRSDQPPDSDSEYAEAKARLTVLP